MTPFTGNGDSKSAHGEGRTTHGSGEGRGLHLGGDSKGSHGLELRASHGSGDPRAAQTVKALLKLRQLILDGELRAGQRVPELWLVKHTGVSRTPIRAALLRLAEEG